MAASRARSQPVQASAARAKGPRLFEISDSLGDADDEGDKLAAVQCLCCGMEAVDCDDAQIATAVALTAKLDAVVLQLVRVASALEAQTERAAQDQLAAKGQASCIAKQVGDAISPTLQAKVHLAVLHTVEAFYPLQDQASLLQKQADLVAKQVEVAIFPMLQEQAQLVTKEIRDALNPKLQEQAMVVPKLAGDAAKLKVQEQINLVAKQVGDAVSLKLQDLWPRRSEMQSTRRCRSRRRSVHSRLVMVRRRSCRNSLTSLPSRSEMPSA